MVTFIPYVPKPTNASNRKPSKFISKKPNPPKNYLPIESSNVPVEMLPAPRGATSEKNWQYTAAGEGIAQGVQDLISANERLGVKSDDQVSDDIIFACSGHDKSNTPDSDSIPNIGNACHILDSRPPSNHVLNPESLPPISNHTAEKHDNTVDFINNDKAPWVSKRQRSDSPLSNGIASYYDNDHNRQRRSSSLILEKKKDETFSIQAYGDLSSTARTTPVLEPTHPVNSNLCLQVTDDDDDDDRDQGWEVRRIIGKEVIDGVTHYLVDWSPTLAPEHSLGHAKELVGKFEDRLRAQREAKNGPRGPGLKRKLSRATRNTNGQHKRPGRQPQEQ